MPQALKCVMVTPEKAVLDEPADFVGIDDAVEQGKRLEAEGK